MVEPIPQDSPDYGSVEHYEHGDDAEQIRSPNFSAIPANMDIAVSRTNDSFATGIILLLVVVLLWTGSNFLTNFQLTQGYDKPFAVTYLNTASFCLYLVPFLVAFQRRRRSHGVTGASHFTTFLTSLGFRLPPGGLWSDNIRQEYSTVATEEDSHRGRLHARSSADIQDLEAIRPSSIDGRRPRNFPKPTDYTMTPPLTLHETATLALQFMVVWFLANYCLNVALKLTSVASATTLSSASGFFTLALGSMAGVEHFSFSKLGAVTMSFVGVLMVTRADSNGTADTLSSENNLQKPVAPFAGDLLALMSAGFYAVYVVLLKKRIEHESRVSMPLFFGFVGLLNVVLMWPVGLVLHYAGLETFSLPSGKVMWTGVLVNMAITVISDMAYLIAMLKSSPLVATVGLSLTIPLAIAGDTLRGSHSGGSQAYLGSAIVLSSFVAIGLADRALARRNITHSN